MPGRGRRLDLFNWSDSPWTGLTQFRLAPNFRVEHYAEDHRFVVRAELPGLDVAKNIGRRTEFRYGSLSRSIELPKRAEAEKITASYDNGILEIVVPLAEAEPADQRIKITPAS